MGEGNDALQETFIDVDANPRGAQSFSEGSASSEATIAADAVTDSDIPVATNDRSRRQQQRRRALSPPSAAAGGVFEENDDDDNDDNLTELEEDDDAPPTPRFMQDEGAWKHWKWVPYPVRRVWTPTVRWTRGPSDARAFTIDPLLPVVQHAPLKLLDRLLQRSPTPRSRWWWRRGLVFGWLALWLLTFALVMRHSIVAGEIAEWGAPGDIGCGNTYWVPGNMCGLDGSDCRPFNNSGFAFRCPASCASYQVLNPRAVGDQEVVYQTLVVGGPGSGDAGSSSSSSSKPDTQQPIYRGDSFICSAAIHAGVVTNAGGGCGVVKLVGQQSQFVASSRHGIKSVGFDSYFPLAFTFEEGVECPGSQDSRWTLLAVSVAFSTVLSLFVTDPALFFFSIFTGLFWHVGLASDPPPHTTVPALLSNIVGKFLPAAFVAWVIFDKMGVRRTLTGLTAQIEKTVLWLGACWVGALGNYTFDAIPIQRLTPHDLAQQPGAKAALSIIVILLTGIVVSQVWYFRQEGRLRKYLQLYALLGAGLIVCLLLPGLSLRIHHYILALLLLPGTSMQTRPALLYQGLLMGLFINGVARWGWDALLQTAAALQGDAQLGSPLPELLTPVIHMANATVAAAATTAATVAAAAAGGNVLRSIFAAGGANADADASTLAQCSALLAANTSTISFSWKPPPGPRYDGISVLVNDVERFRSYFDDLPASGASNVFVWERPADAAVNEYFRFAYMEGSQSDDYTRAGIWTADGEWVPMPPGPSRVRSRNLDGEKRR
ncbi:lccl domain containing protein [Niveomyces insectorum RCEF 264]|uniref:Lccl domain containing protein n=1 Tax=Niveomyces insectorum RCEF 264 TaxID=1081102 RepID=A0A162MNH2_9HYPO|nr:lccl domain containing protein [Niveomyces insectorum RCEF 264]